MRRLLTLLSIAGALAAQEMVAPTPDEAGPARGDNTVGYNITDSFELGYRFATVGGDLGMYRSAVNFGDGLRLLSSKLTINSLDGHGSFFDDIILTTQGLGGDPYEMSSLRIEKNGLYRYDMLWRLNDYFNPALTISNGQHLLNTERRMQDHDLTLFPKSALRFFIGYSRNAQDGMGLSTVNLFNIRGTEFPLFSNINRLENEYRLGGEMVFAGIKLNILHGWDYYSEGFNTPYVLAGPPDEPAIGTTLSSFQRNAPYHGSSPYWRLSLFAERKWISLGARYNYTSGGRNFLLNESALGTSQFSLQSQQVSTFGTGRRPTASGNLNVSLFPTSKLTVTNQTSFYNLTMEGDSTYVQFDNASQIASIITFERLAIRTITNATDATYRARKWLGFYAGYHFSTRSIQSAEIFNGSPFPTPAQQTNNLHAGLAGIRMQPLKPLTVRLEAEIGRADHPFTPYEDGSYHAINGLIQYKMKTLTLSGGFNSNYNFNSVAISQYSAKSRNYTAGASWAAKDWLTLDASYAKMDTNTIAGIAYFATGQLVTGNNSIYISNIHFGNLGARFALGKRADLFLGYSRVQDVGDGRSNPLGTFTPMLIGVPAGQLPSLPIGFAAFPAAQTFPLTYETPSARVSVALRTRLRWNAGYQYYHYLEQFGVLQNYRAHTGYSSLTWSF
jgi:hypothetical protein